jgi:Uncharacterized protein conserved in bacteria (DUF2057)
MKKFGFLFASAVALLLGSGCVSRQAPLVVLYGGAAEDVAQLRIPFSVDIRDLDGNQVAKGLGRDEVILQIGPGNHKAEVRYSVLYPLTGNDYEKVESDYYRISFDCAAGGSYRIECDDHKTLEATRRFARKPVFRVIPVSLPSAKPANKTVPAPAPAVKDGNDTSSVELKRMWDNATPAERKAFLDSITSPKSTMTKPMLVP